MCTKVLVSIVSADALVLKHQAISTINLYSIITLPGQFHNGYIAFNLNTHKIKKNT